MSALSAKLRLKSGDRLYLPNAPAEVREALTCLTAVKSPGPYASLVVKPLFSWRLAPRPARERAEPRPRPTPEQIREERRKTGFLARQRARKVERRARRPGGPADLDR